MTLPLPSPYIVKPDGSADADGVQRNFEVIAQAFIDTGGRSIKVRFGSSSVTFTASSLSAQVTVPHGMGSIPVALFLSLKQPQNGQYTLHENAAADATNVYVLSRQSYNVAVTATQAFYWLAIG